MLHTVRVHESENFNGKSVLPFERMDNVIALNVQMPLIRFARPPFQAQTHRLHIRSVQIIIGHAGETFGVILKDAFLHF